MLDEKHIVDVDVGEKYIPDSISTINKLCEQMRQRRDVHIDDHNRILKKIATEHCSVAVVEQLIQQMPDSDAILNEVYGYVGRNESVSEQDKITIRRMITAAQFKRRPNTSRMEKPRSCWLYE